MKGRWAAGCALAVVLLLAGLAGWHWWPRPVAPELTPQMVNIINSADNGTITPIAGGSKKDAHTLWKRYHDRDVNGTAPRSPRLQGISLVKLTTQTVPGSGTCWVVYSDKVWMKPMIGSKSGYARQVIFLDPKTLQAVSSMDF